MLSLHLIHLRARCRVLSRRAVMSRTAVRVCTALLCFSVALMLFSPVWAEDVACEHLRPDEKPLPGAAAEEVGYPAVISSGGVPQEGGWSGESERPTPGPQGGWSGQVKPSSTSVPGSPVAVPSPPDWPLLVWDDFSNPELTWSPVGSLQHINRDFHDNGELRINLNGEAGDLEAFLFSVHQYRDFRVDVDVHRSVTRGHIYAGLELRDQSGMGDVWHSYSFLVRSDGYYMVTVQLGGLDTRTVLHEATPPSCIRTGAHAANHLTVVAQGPRMDFYANGCFLTSVTDDRLAEGDIGLSASLADADGQGEVRFDNFRVYSLEPLRPVTFGAPASSLLSRHELTEWGEPGILGTWAFPAEPVTQFPAGTKHVYVYFPFEGLTSERVFRSATLLNGEEAFTSGPYRWGEMVIDSGSTGFGVLYWDLTMSGGTDLPLGHYERQVFVDDVLVARALFSVGVDTPPSAVEPLEVRSAAAPPRPALPPAAESFQKAAELYGQGRYAEALPYCELAMAAEPNSTYYIAESAKCFDAAGSPERAEMLRLTAQNFSAGAAATPSADTASGAP